MDYPLTQALSSPSSQKTSDDNSHWEKIDDYLVILVVDDTPHYLTQVSELLEDDYIVKIALSGARALQIAQTEPMPSLILLDIMMPEMSGYEVCRQLKANPTTANIPVIFMTASTDMDDEEHGFSLGAVDYIIKPIVPKILQARVKTHLTLKSAADFMRDKAAYLEREIARRTAEIRDMRDVTIHAMATLAESRENETANHILRTQNYVRSLAVQLQKHPRFSHELNEEVIDLLYKSAPLHDLGKIGIPDYILMKTEPLTEDELEIMKTHTTLGRDAIEQAEHRLGKTVPFLNLAKEIAWCHQEKWDGTGYPRGLIGNQIPISARLMALADAYDGLIHPRNETDFYSHEEVISILEKERGKHFDPDVFDAFLVINNEFKSVAEWFSDDDDPSPV